MNLLIVGVKGRVLGMSKTNGEKVWETHLKSSEFVNVYVDQDLVYASTRGELFCLESNSGRIVWHNKMKGLGYGMISFGWDPASQTVQAAHIQTQQHAAAAAGVGASAAH